MPLKDPTKSLSMGEEKASRTSEGTQTEGDTEAEESDKKSNTSKGTHKQLMNTIAEQAPGGVYQQVKSQSTSDWHYYY